MSKLKNRLIEFATDIFTIETAFLEETGDDRHVIAYSKVQFEGDAIHFVNADLSNETTVLLHNSTLTTSVNSRYALIRILSEALR